MNALTYGSTTLALPDDLRWVDEFNWQAVEQRTSYTIFGALRCESAPKLAGRTMRLEGDEQSAFITRLQLLQLEAWKAQPGLVMTLTFRDVDYQVVFDQQGGAVDAQTIHPISDPGDTDYYTVKLRFLQV